MLWSPLYIAWIVSEVLIAVLTRTKRGEGKVRDRGSQPLLWITIFISMTLCGFAKADVTPSFPKYFSTVSLIILALGLAVRWLSVLSLGKAFSANVAIRTSQRIYQSGLYSMVRHPSYSGLLLIFLAAGLHARNLIGLVCAVVPTTAALLFRIHVEEDALINAFGDDYRSYRSRTKRLVPWVF